MGDAFQVVIVTVVAAGALLIVVAPFVRRRKPAGKHDGCATCGSAPAGARSVEQKQA